MSQTLMELKRVFETGRTYLEYVEGGDEETKVKHLHYHQKMTLTREFDSFIDRKTLKALIGLIFFRFL